MRYKTVFLDCDGVILDSNAIKTDAFRDALSDYPQDKVAELIAYHQRNGGVSRYRKFEYFFRDILDDYTQRRYEDALAGFENAVLDRLKNASFTRGAMEFLDAARQCADLYVISGGAENELVEVFEHKGCAHYFQAIKGSPTSKSEHFAALLERVEQPAVFIGDSSKDWEVAAEYGIDFIFLSDYTDLSDWRLFCAQQRLEHYPNFERLMEANAIRG